MIKLIPEFSNACVLVYGDLMLDRYWSGLTQRISPEAPVPVVNVQSRESRAGGAANVALNVAALGSAVTCLGLVGDDAEADELDGIMSAAAVNGVLQRFKSKSTITKLRVLGQNQQLLRLDFEQQAPGQRLLPDQDTLLNFKQALDAGCNVVVLSDYAKGARYCFAEMIELARAAGCSVLIDPKSTDFSIYHGATLLTPNLSEFEAVVGPCPDVATMVAAAERLIAAHDLGALLITRGAAGMLLVERGGHVLELSAKAQEVFDVTGAGDTVIAVLAACLSAGCALQDGVALANIAAGLVVRKVGAATVSPAELRRQCQRLADSHLGVVSEDQAVQMLQDARAHGETVVMTNGCFDILHAGHIQYLNQAKQLGHRLLVAVNSDESVRGLKGDSRPINALEDRMAMLAALRAVDWVVPFTESTPQRLIANLLPDVLVKGGDYRVEQIAGAREVMANGGSVKILDFKPGCSTTGLVNKIREEMV